jgi:hypothetical protein
VADGRQALNKAVYRQAVRGATTSQGLGMEAREILKAGLASEQALGLNLADSIRRHIKPEGRGTSRPAA